MWDAELLLDILTVLTRSKRTFLQCYQNVSPTDFSGDEWVMDVAESVWEYFAKYNKLPNEQELKDAVIRSLPQASDEEKQAHRLIVKKIFEAKGWRKYTYDVLMEKVRETRMRNKVAGIQSALSGGSASVEEVKQELTKLLLEDEGQGADVMGMDWEQTAMDRHIKRQGNTDDAIRTNLPFVDEHIGGGSLKKRLYVLLGPTSVGKSAFLVHLANAAMLLQKTVFYYTLELDAYEVGSRLDSCLLGVPFSNLRNLDIPTKLKDRLSTLKRGKLIIKEYPTYGVSVNALFAHMDLMKANGIVPDLVLVDYADLMRSGDKHNDKRHELLDVYRNLRRLATTYDVPVWTPSQVQRESYEKEVKLTNAAEAITKMEIADVVMAISVTDQQGYVRLSILKNRMGRREVSATIKQDLENMRFIDEKVKPKMDTDEPPPPPKPKKQEPEKEDSHDDF